MTTQPDPLPSNSLVDSPKASSGNGANADIAGNGNSAVSMTSSQYLTPLSTLPIPRNPNPQNAANSSVTLIILISIAISIFGLSINNSWIGMAGAIVSLLVSVPVIWPPLQQFLEQSISPKERSQFVASLGVLVALFVLLKFLGIFQRIGRFFTWFEWDEFGSWAEWTGAVGQIMIAILAVYIAWRQYVISKDLTIQQNIITQQQTIDAYFQGVCDLALDDEGLLEDWPQERAFSEGRTAAILSSVDAGGKAKVLRFLSQSRLLTPLQRDRHLGRPMLDGNGGYLEDRIDGVRMINLNVMLAGADLSYTDLRWTELSDANMVRANLSHCDLVQANLARTILYEANLEGADLLGVRLFYGSVETSSPRSRTKRPNYDSGEYTGTVVENANFTGVLRLGEEQRQYCCSWCGEKSRKTIPGGCEGIPNKLGR